MSTCSKVVRVEYRSYFCSSSPAMAMSLYEQNIIKRNFKQQKKKVNNQRTIKEQVNKTILLFFFQIIFENKQHHISVILAEGLHCLYNTVLLVKTATSTKKMSV